MILNRRRWSDNDHYSGPFTFAKSKYKSFAIVASSGEEEYPGCSLRISIGGYTVIVALPNIIPSYREKVNFSYVSPEQLERMGQDWYWKIDKREYGFSLSSGGDAGIDFIQVFYGRHPHDGDSRTQQSWSWFLPWKQKRHVRHSHYDLNGEHWMTEPNQQRYTLTPQGRTKHEHGWNRDAVDAAVSSCPTKTFSFTDFDGEQLTAKTRIEESEWHHGTGLFKWLSWFIKPMIRRSLYIKFSGETGRRKESWKGGTIGCGIEMLQGELHESAFRRYCEGDDTRHSKKRDMIFLGEV